MTQPEHANRPSDQSLIATLMQEVLNLTDQRLYLKAQVTDLQRQLQQAQADSTEEPAEA